MAFWMAFLFCERSVVLPSNEGGTVDTSPFLPMSQYVEYDVPMLLADVAVCVMLSAGCVANWRIAGGSAPLNALRFFGAFKAINQNKSRIEKASGFAG